MATHEFCCIFLSQYCNKQESIASVGFHASAAGRLHYRATYRSSLVKQGLNIYRHWGLLKGL